MKIIPFLIALLWFSLPAQDSSDVRAEYRLAAKNQEKAEKLYEALSATTETDNVLFIAYKGATATLMAKYAKGVKSKTTYFKEGKSLIEQAIEAAPENIELRYIRLSVQENAPRIVRYNNEIAEDKQFILDHYDGIKDAGTKKYIKGFVSQSTSFSDAEKELF